MKTNEKICRAAVTLTAMIISVFGAFSIADKIDGFVESQKRHETKAELAMTSVNKISEKAAQSVFEKNRQIESDTDNTDNSDNTDTDTDHTFETTYLVTESLYRESNMSCGNFYVKNATNLTPDLKGYLNADLPFEYEDTEQPQVLIVHTHSTESYMDSDLGYYYESFYPRDEDDRKNVISVGDAITESLKEEGITAAHSIKHHDDPSYLGAYDSSAETINSYLERYPTIKIIFDIHRDSITTDENEKIKPTFTYNGEKAAQIMIMCGNSNNGYYDFDNWEENMSLAVKLQSKAEEMYPGMTRPLYFGNFMYNMNLAPGSLLIEIGTDANTHEEAMRTGEYLGKVTAAVLKSSYSG
ncbi:MAG: stage II sporulation protein P [Clostridia bacterium]|nr:stage II sporulation protein P [Clostridia bacterium]